MIISDSDLQVVDQIKSKIKDLSSENLLNREPRFSCCVDGFITFKIKDFDCEHYFHFKEVHGFSDGMDLSTLLDYGKEPSYECFSEGKIIERVN